MRGILHRFLSIHASLNHQVKKLTKHLQPIKGFEENLCIFLTFYQEEEADDPGGGDDQPRNDEGHPPRGGDVNSGDERTQDVSH